jgi:hypothetical protein
MCSGLRILPARSPFVPRASVDVLSVNRTTAHQLRLISTTFDHIVFATEQMDVWAVWAAGPKVETKVRPGVNVRLKAAFGDIERLILSGLLLGSLSFSLLGCGFSFLRLGLNLLRAQCRFEFMNRLTKRKIVVNHRFLQVGKWNVEVL